MSYTYTWERSTWRIFVDDLVDPLVRRRYASVVVLWRLVVAPLVERCNSERGFTVSLREACITGIRDSACACELEKPSYSCQHIGCREGINVLQPSGTVWNLATVSSMTSSLSVFSISLLMYLKRPSASPPTRVDHSPSTALATLEDLLDSVLLPLKAPLGEILEQAPTAVPARDRLDVHLAFDS